MTDLTRNIRDIQSELVHARGGLVQELVDVFNIAEIRGRGRTRSEWTIGGLVLPVPGDMKRTLLGVFARPIACLQMDFRRLSARSY